MTSFHIEGVCAGYGRARIIEGLSLALLSGGKVVGLLGPNASGKSTLLKSVAGVHPADFKRVSLQLGEQEITGKELRDHVGYVPQDIPKSAALTAFETVVVAGRRYFGAQAARLRAAETLHELGIAHIAQKYLSDMSGGQRQLVAVAQMLVTDPAVMLLDEPTSALDLHRQIFLLEHVRNQVQRTSAVALVALHDINLAARYCDELVVTKAGELVAQGAPGEVLTPGLLLDVYGVEADVLVHDGGPLIALPNAHAGVSAG